METLSAPNQPRALDIDARGRIGLSGRVHTSAQAFLSPIAVATGEVLQ